MKIYKVTFLVCMLTWSFTAHAGLFAQLILAVRQYVASKLWEPEHIRDFTYQEVALTKDTRDKHIELYKQTHIALGDLNAIYKGDVKDLMLFAALDPRSNLVGSLLLTKKSQMQDNYYFELTSMVLAEKTVIQQPQLAGSFWSYVTHNHLGNGHKQGTFIVQAAKSTFQLHPQINAFLEEQQFTLDQVATDQIRAQNKAIERVYIYRLLAGGCATASPLESDGLNKRRKIQD